MADIVALFWFFCGWNPYALDAIDLDTTVGIPSVTGTRIPESPTNQLDGLAIPAARFLP
jgi:hypothetical protein